MNRRSYSLKLVSFSELEVKVPKHYSDSEIRSIIQKHSKWIQKHLISYSPSKVNLIKELESFSKIIYLGETYNLSYDNSLNYEGKGFKIINEELFFRTRNKTFENIKKSYKENLNKLLYSFYESNSVLQAFKFTNIRMSDASSRWGSCSTNGNINISWRLMMAPQDVIYSVFAHELAHTKVFNHSDDFYNLLYSIDSKNQESDIWLKENGYILKLYKNNYER